MGICWNDSGNGLELCWSNIEMCHMYFNKNLVGDMLEMKECTGYP